MTFRLALRASRIRDQVLLVLVIAAAVAVASSGFVGYAPNRLVSSEPISLWRAGGGLATGGIVAIGIILLAACFIEPRKSLHYAVAFSGACLLFLVLAAAGGAASVILQNAKTAARVSLGAAFWILAACAVLAIGDALQRLRASIAMQIVTIIMIVSGTVLLAAEGTLNALSIAREYATHQTLFAAALLRHMSLVGVSVGAALVIGFPVGVAAAKFPRLQNPIFATLNVLQTIPSIALFGLLIVPLSALVAAVPRLATFGIGGIGVAPAIIALVLYALLPVVRNTSVGLTTVDSAVVEAGRGMGLSGRQIFWQLELPLALPIFLAGLRIVTVQAIGLTVVAALIGAGGLGTFVFEGLGQYAVDLVLLGSLPAIFLALAADFMLRLLTTLLRRHSAP